MDVRQANGSVNNNNMAGKGFYSFRLEDDKNKKGAGLRSIVLMQMFILFVFIMGLVIGLCIGIFVYHPQTSNSTSDLSDQSDKDPSKTETLPLKESSTLSPPNDHDHHDHSSKQNTTEPTPKSATQQGHTSKKQHNHTHTHTHTTTQTPNRENTPSNNMLGHDLQMVDHNLPKEPVRMRILERGHIHMTDSGPIIHDHSDHSHGHSHGNMDESQPMKSTHSHSHGHNNVDQPHTGNQHSHVIDDNIENGATQPDAHGNDHAHTHQNIQSGFKLEGFDLSSIPLGTVLTPFKDPKPCKECNKREPHTTTQHKKLYSPLTSAELQLTFDTLRERGYVNFGPGEVFPGRANFIYFIDLKFPVKQEALDYLDHNGPFPGRSATVLVNKAAEEPPYIMEYTVGRLDGFIDNITVVEEYKRDEVPYHRRPYDNFEMQTLLGYIYEHLDALSEIIGESFDAPEPSKQLNVIPTGPHETAEGKRITRFSITFKGLGAYDMDFLSAIPFSAKVNHESFNTSDWYMYDYVYLNQGPFRNSSVLYTEYYYNTIKKIKFPTGSRDKIQLMAFPQRDVYQLVRENSQYPGPTTYESSGPRFTIEDNDVSWLGWTFTATSTSMRGPAIFNVRFKNESVVYENSLNDIALAYGADDPGKDNTVYNDNEFGIGHTIPKPIRGISCPEHGFILNVSSWEPGYQKPKTQESICIFEKDGQEALWRHNGKNFNVGLRNRYLVVRYPTTVGNYDYTFDFEFHLDGKMKTKAVATGFIFGGFLNPYTENFGESGKSPFGYKVGSFVTGLVHDHSFGFKVDLDVAGSQNDFEIINWKVGSVEEATRSIQKNATVPDYFFKNQTRYIKWESVKTERGLKIDSANPKFWTVVNNNAKNAWNVSRGYRIVPMASGTQNFMEDYDFFGSLAFTENHCTVTKRKENEQFNKPLFRYYKKENTSEKLLYLPDMVNDETIVNEDIVTWISLGFHHIPTSEDVPVTSRVETGFTLKPFNFFDTTATHDVPQYTKIDKSLFDYEPEPDSNCYIKP